MNWKNDIRDPIIPTTDQIRQCEQYTMQTQSISSLELMERAGQKCAQKIQKIIQKQKPANIFIFCGTGNNGGDGLVIARALASNSSIEAFSPCSFHVILCQNEQSKRTLELEKNLTLWQQIAEEHTHCHLQTFNPQKPLDITENSIIIDAIFGIGLNKPAQGLHAEAIRQINQSDAYTIAIDTPSGLFSDVHTPHAHDIVMADITLSIQFVKLAYFTGEAYPFYGNVEVVDIDMVAPPDTTYSKIALTLPNIQPILYPVNPYAHKGTFGHGLLIAGSADMPGATILAASSAMRGGLGKLTVHTVSTAAQALTLHLPEAILHRDNNEQVISELNWSTLQSNINAIAIGPGIGTHSKTVNLIKNVLDEVHAPLIIDADALNILAQNKTWLAFLPNNSILTPHFKEFERLAGPCNNDFDRIQKAKQFAERYNIILILKGHHTVISLPNGKQFFNTTGHYGLATAGSGDVLTGLLLALMAQGYSPSETALLGVFIHGLAGEQGYPTTMIASDIAQHYTTAFQTIQEFRHNHISSSDNNNF